MLLIRNRENFFSFLRIYFNTCGLVEFSLRETHSLLFVYWSINYAERVTNKRVVCLIAGEKSVILGMPTLKKFKQAQPFNNNESIGINN